MGSRSDDAEERARRAGDEDGEDAAGEGEAPQPARLLRRRASQPAQPEGSGGRPGGAGAVREQGQVVPEDERFFLD